MDKITIEARITELEQYIAENPGKASSNKKKAIELLKSLSSALYQAVEDIDL